MTPETLTRPGAPRAVPFAEALRTWSRIGLLSFGGPAGQIGLMHRVLVDEKRWISERRFLHALDACMLLPGPEATQLATYVGWLLHGWRGGLLAGTLFVLPGFLSIALLSILYVVHQQSDEVTALFYGLKAATLAVVVEAVIRVGRRSLRNRTMGAVAAAAFVALFVFEVPFPIVVLSAAILGFFGAQRWPHQFVRRDTESPLDPDPQVVLHDRELPNAAPTTARALRVTAIGLTLWLGPVIALHATLGPRHVFCEETALFSKAAVVTFGGAYAVLGYVAQQAVEVYGWLKPGEMLDGLGLAETTPGPLIQVVQYVAFLGAYRRPGGLDPLAAALIASLLVTWVTFVPCFLWIFLGAPYVERLRGHRHVTAALSTVTAAVVGVILDLSVRFAIQVAFGRVEEWRGFGTRWWIPDASTFDPAAVILGLSAFWALWTRRLGLLPTLLGAALVGGLYAYAGRPLLG